MEKRILSMLLAIVMVVGLLPSVTVTALAEDHLCEHHAEHTAECGYVEGVSDCAYHCDICLGHDHGDEATEEDTEPAPVCTCESDDPDWHAPFCALFEMPEDAECYCSELCDADAPNEWCEVCYFDANACGGSGEVEAAAYATTPSYIASIGVAQDGSSGSTGVNDCKKELSGHIIIDRDLNDDAGGDYVYMGYKTTTDPSRAITGIVFRVGGSPPDSIDYNGYTFYLVGGSYETNTASQGGYIDLNGYAGGVYIYTYVTRDSGYGAPLTAMTVNESSSYSGWITGTNTSGNVIDLNQEAGGDYLYLHYKRFSATVGADYYYLTSNGVRTSASFDIAVKNHLETKYWAPSVSSTVTYGGNTYTFLGWREDNTAAAASTTSPSVTYMTGSKTYRAVYSGTLTLRYDANGGTGAPKAQTLTHYINAGSSAMAVQRVRFTVPSAVPVQHETCKALGWSTDSTAAAPNYTPGSTVTAAGNTTLYAVYGSKNGFCSSCGAYQSAKLVNGVYEIYNAGQLYWFAGRVNSGETAINGKLMADIVVNEDVLNADGALNGNTFRDWTPIGSNSAQYTGTFNGNGKTISGLYYNNSSTRQVGLFGHVTLGGVVQNVTVTDSYLHGEDCTGGVVGYNSGTVQNVIVMDSCIIGAYSVGGVVGYNSSGTIQNCGNTAAISAWSSDGGITGRSDYGIITNCYDAGTAHYGVLAYNNYGTVSNCYDLADRETGMRGGIAAKTSAQFASGEVAYLLNGSVSGGTPWKQTIGTHATPNFTGGTVYSMTGCDQKTVVAYSNTANQKAGHSYNTNGFCVLCDAYEPAVLVKGIYEIGNAGQLYWFAALVNGGATSANARLTDHVLEVDSSLNGNTSRDWVPIGSESMKYTGTFDGNGKTISGLYYYNSEGKYVGLFGYVAGGTIQNVGVVDSYIAADSYVGGVVGQKDGGSIKNCWYSGTITGRTAKVGGVVGYNNGGTVSNCYKTGTISGNGIQVGGIAGYSGGTVTNCYNTGSVSGSFVGGIVGYGEGKNSVTNCYNTGSVSGSSYVGSISGFSSGTAANCYYLADSETDSIDSTTAKTAKAFASGEVAYLLNQGLNGGTVWGQTIGTDDSPVLGGKTVYPVVGCDGKAVAGYSNTKDVRADHTPDEDDGDCTTAIKCSVCGTVTTPAAKNHTPAEAVREKEVAATCKAAGSYDEVIYCSVCGDEISRTGKTLPLAEHVYGALIPIQAEVHTKTDLKAGIAAHYFCSACGTYFTESKTATTLEALTGDIPAHSYGDWITSDADNHWKACSCGLKTEEGVHVYDDDRDAACNTCGYERTLVHEHTFADMLSYDAHNHWYASTCGHDVTRGLEAHHGGTATCEAKAVCMDCGQSYGDLGDHADELQWIQTPATHKQIYICCGTIKVNEASHDWGEGNVCTTCHYGCTHTYGNPVFEWQTDGSAKVTVTCSNCEAPETLDCEITSQWDQASGKVKLTATATVDGETVTDNSQFLQLQVSGGKLTVTNSTVGAGEMLDMIIMAAGYSGGQMTGYQVIEDVIGETEGDLTVAGDSMKVFFLNPVTRAPLLVCAEL